jgi:glyoxylase-like metal-dependent hydrolase (beta-lactamase superfamily II)
MGDARPHYDACMRTRWLVSILAFMAAAVPARAATELLNGVHVIRGTFAPGSQPDGNSVILTAPEGLIVIDTGRHAAHTQAILDFAKETGRPIAAVVNTHWHLDHIGGNALIRREYPAVRIHASGALRDALTGFLANYRTQLAAMVADPATDAATKKSFQTEIALIDAGAKLAPDVVVSGSGATTIAGRALHVGLETHSVTAGDVWVLDEKSGVLIAGDLVTLPAPFLDTACPARWQESLDRLASLEFDLLVPGHGASMTRTQFTSYRRAYRELLACAARTDAPKEQCIDGWAGTLGPLMSGFDDRFTRSLMAYYVDLLRGDPAKIAAACASPAE